MLVLTHATGRGKTSCVPLDQPNVTVLFHMRSGKVTRPVFFNNRDRALADLGLMPEDG